MFTDAVPIQFQDELPDAVDAVIIGAGVIGIGTALHLKRQGASVLVCEKGRVAGEQSSRNWGWIRQQGRDPAELPIVTESLGLWEKYAAELNEDIGFTRQGVTFAATTEEELASIQAWIKVAEQNQLDTRMLAQSEAVDLLGLPGESICGAMTTPSDGRAEPFVAVPALARYFRNHGGIVREGCAVRALDIVAGHVRGVFTEHGKVRSETVLLAGGAWSNTFLRNHDVDIPQLLVRGTVLRTEPSEQIFSGALTLGGLGIRRRQDGGYTIASALTEHFPGLDSLRHFGKYLPAMRENWHNLGLRVDQNVFNRFLPTRRWTPDEASPFESDRVLNPKPSKRALALIDSALERHLPVLASQPIAQTWAGMIDVMPDVVPIMDAVPNLPGLYLATGFSAHGFGIGLGAGRVMGDMMRARPLGHDLDRFRFARFSDGTAICPGPGL